MAIHLKTISYFIKTDSFVKESVFMFDISNAFSLLYVV